MLPLMLVFCRAVESAPVSTVWTDSRHQRPEGIKPTMKGEGG